MPDDPGTLNLPDSLSQGHRRVEVQPPDPVFGQTKADGVLGRMAHYRVVKQLGCGGMGAVYLAQDEGLDRRVALKVMLPAAAADPLAKERFLREARAAAAVQHDNVVTIYQVGEDRGVPYLAMEYLAGAPLDRYLARKGRLSLPQVLRLGQETAEGLAAAHAKGLIHRDIKPANLWLEAPKGRVKILDFGIARRVADDQAGLTGVGTVVGTPGYMSPEQARGKTLDHRSDLFSLGVVLYELLTGRAPFEGDSVLAILTALAVDHPPPVSSLNPEAPPELDALIRGLLAKRPEDRPPSALVLAEELRQVATGGGPVPLAEPVSAAVPKVVYVPIAVTSHESLNPSEFDGLGRDSTELLTERPRPAVARGGNRGMWVAAGVSAVLAVALLAGVIYALKKPAPTPEPTPEPTPPPAPKQVPPKPSPPKVDPVPSGRGLVFAPDQFVEVPGLVLPAEGPFTLEGYVTVDDGFRGEGNVFGSRNRFRTVVAERPGEARWELHGAVGGDSPSVSGPAVSKGRRAHVAAVRTPTELRLFVDGKALPARPVRGALGVGDPFRIGGERFAGTVEEVRVSSTARYDRDFTPPVRLDADRDTTALYQFDEGAGDAVRDSAGGYYPGRVTGGARWVTPKADPGPWANPLTTDEFNQVMPRYLLSHRILGGRAVTPQEVNALRGMRFLHTIQIGPLDDSAFEKMSDLPLAADLRAVVVLGPDGILPLTISDAAMAHAPRFKELGILEVRESRIGDDGLKPLASMAKLTHLTLRKCRVTDKAAARLAELRTVTALDLSDTQFGDEGIKGLADMPSLTHLTLRNNPVTDAGLEHLHGRKLSLLNVQGTQVTAEGIRKLRQANPALTVVSSVKP